MQRKIIYQCAISLDGFIEDHEGKFDWCLTDFDFDMQAFLDNIDTILYGRKTFEVFLNMGEVPDPTKTHYVFSSRKEDQYLYGKWIQTDAVAFVQDLTMQEGKDIWFMGGATLAGSLAEAGLVDELQLAVHPIALGRGTPLFKGLHRRLPYFPYHSQTYSNGLTMVYYRLRL